MHDSSISQETQSNQLQNFGTAAKRFANGVNSNSASLEQDGGDTPLTTAMKQGELGKRMDVNSNDYTREGFNQDMTPSV